MVDLLSLYAAEYLMAIHAHRSEEVRIYAAKYNASIDMFISLTQCRCLSQVLLHSPKIQARLGFFEDDGSKVSVGSSSTS